MRKTKERNFSTNYYHGVGRVIERKMRKIYQLYFSYRAALYQRYRGDYLKMEEERMVTTGKGEDQKKNKGGGARNNHCMTGS